ncbi:MAG: hypothetical protein PHZ09_00160 [Eubacteriales bacterium]|nr:hypothetical protein [Eubacteriales bacterium]
MKKTLILLLICAMILPGCAQSPGGTSDTALTAVTESELETTVLSDNLPEADYEGYSFRMLIRNDKGWIEDMYAEELNGDIMNDAIFLRNAAVGERFGVSFEVIPSSNANYDNDGVKSILANEDAYDIIIPHARASFDYALQELLLDWNTDLPFVDLDKPWWDQDIRESLRINYKLLMMIGDISYKNLGATNAMLFNKNLFDDLGLDYPYQLVHDDAWTFDKLVEYAEMGTIDINGDGKIAFADDQIGYVTDEWIGPIQVLYSGNQRIVQKDDNDLPYLSLNTNLTIEIFNAFFALIDGDAGHCAPWEGLDTSIASADGIYGRFTNNQALFLDTNIRGTIFLRNMDANFGIVPWPKFDETIDKYYSNVDAGCNLIIVPITAGDPERTSIIIEGLSAEGYKNVTPAYFEVALATKYARDEESADMLDIVKAGRIYDLGYYNNALSVFNSIGQYMFTTKNRDFASLYAKNEKNANKNLDKTIEAYGG